MDFNWFSLCAASYSETLDDGILGLPIPVGWFASQHIGVILIFVMYCNEYERGLPLHQSEALLDGVDKAVWVTIQEIPLLYSRGGGGAP